MDQLRSAEELASAIGIPVSDWKDRCHGISLAIVQAGVFLQARVARGGCTRVHGQHSWIVLGNDCYARDARICDPTMGCHDTSVLIPWYGSARDGMHTPKGKGSIWGYGKPGRGDGPAIELARPLSDEAGEFLYMVHEGRGLDFKGWMALANCPIGGWPSKEIFEAMLDTPALGSMVPIDVAGMLTDRNPGGLYLREELKV